MGLSIGQHESGPTDVISLDENEDNTGPWSHLPSMETARRAHQNRELERTLTRLQMHIYGWVMRVILCINCILMVYHLHTLSKVCP
jgi:hypothetical protein